jgi:hypothetical protein
MIFYSRTTRRDCFPYIEENVVAYLTTRSGKRLDKSPSMSNHEAIERENDPSKFDIRYLLLDKGYPI